MKGKILKALQTKFSGVEATILARIAESRATTITDEAEIPTLVEGIGFQDVLTSYGDFRAGNASISAVKNYEKKHNLKDGNPIVTEEPKPSGQEKNNPKPKEEVPEWAQAIIDANKTLSEKLEGYEAEKNKRKRSALILAKAKEYGIPENLVSMLHIAEDADLDTYMTDAKQTFANMGFKDMLRTFGIEQSDADLVDIRLSVYVSGEGEMEEHLKRNVQVGLVHFVPSLCFVLRA